TFAVRKIIRILPRDVFSMSFSQSPIQRGYNPGTVIPDNAQIGRSGCLQILRGAVVASVVDNNNFKFGISLLTQAIDSLPQMWKSISDRKDHTDHSRPELRSSRHNRCHLVIRLARAAWQSRGNQLQTPQQ